MGTFTGKLRRSNGFTEDPMEIKEEIASFLEALYLGEGFLRRQLDGLAFPIIALGLKSYRKETGDEVFL